MICCRKRRCSKGATGIVVQRITIRSRGHPGPECCSGRAFSSNLARPIDGVVRRVCRPEQRSYQVIAAIVRTLCDSVRGKHCGNI